MSGGSSPGPLAAQARLSLNGTTPTIEFAFTGGDIQPAGLLAASGAVARATLRRRRPVIDPPPGSGRCTTRQRPSSGPTSAAT